MSPAPSPPGPGWDSHVHVFDPAAPVRAGHYRPVHRPLAEVEALAGAQGLHHLVLVQPSVYGHDHRVLLDALQAAPGRHRGVAVVAADVAEAELDRLHAAGVRGARFNLVSPAGQGTDAERVQAALLALAPRLRARGWHCQWYVAAAWLPQLVHWQARSGLVFVLDHLAGLGTQVAQNDPAWTAAAALANEGAWLKLSGWYRLQAAPPYTALHAAIGRAAALFGPRLLWGSDWPHTSFAPDALPPYASLLAPARAVLGDPALARVLAEHPKTLYG